MMERWADVQGLVQFAQLVAEQDTWTVKLSRLVITWVVLHIAPKTYFFFFFFFFFFLIAILHFYVQFYKKKTKVTYITITTYKLQSTIPMNIAYNTNNNND